MHTTKVLRSEHVVYCDGSGALSSFDAFCPDYAEDDRLVVVSPHLEDGILGASAAILAITTAFYDLQRSQSDDFFIYPQHFAVFDGNSESVRTRGGRVPEPIERESACYGNLDVWPQSQWINVEGGASVMLAAALDTGGNRLLWPADLDGPIDRDALDRAAASLKWVALYGSVDEPTHTLHLDTPFADMIAGSVRALPDDCATRDVELDDCDREMHTYQAVDVDDFVKRFA